MTPINMADAAGDIVSTMLHQLKDYSSSGGNSSLDNQGTGKKLYLQLNELKTVYMEISSSLCTALGQTTVANISPDDFRKSNKLQKKDLGEFVLSLLAKCSVVCNRTNLDSLTCPNTEIQMEAISECIRSNIEKHSRGQDIQFKEIQKQIARLQSFSDSLVREQNYDNFSHSASMADDTQMLDTGHPHVTINQLYTS